MQTLTINDFLAQASDACVIDVRSEGEYGNAHLPGAINIPIFNDQERTIIGTLYKKEGKEAAVLRGLEITGPKLSGFVTSAKEAAPNKKVMVYCWRGGMRSGSFGWLLETAGFDVTLLKGGYKSYRKEVLHFLDQAPLQLRVIGGCTGSGKTEIIQALKEKGEQVIDLESMANHRGSAFGGLGLGEQPSQEEFDSRLYQAIQKLDTHKPIWIEDESKNIGRTFLPLHILDLIQKAPVIVIDLNKENRIERLVKDYANHGNNLLEAAVYKVRKRLGGDNYKKSLEALAHSNYEVFAGYVLYYYDKIYQEHLKDKQSRIVSTIKLDTFDSPKIADQLIGLKF